LYDPYEESEQFVRPQRRLLILSKKSDAQIMRKLLLLIYYGFAWHLPSQPMPGWKFAYAVRRFLVKRIFQSCGEGVVVKQHAYFGDGNTLNVGNRVRIGINSRIDRDVTLGDDVMIGQDVVILTSGHAYEDPTVPINQQGAAKSRPVKIGRDVLVGTRVVILPGVEIGEGSVIGAGSIVRSNIPPFSVAAGNGARVFWKRGQFLKKTHSKLEG